MNELPKTWERWTPRIAGALGLFLTLVNNDGDWYSKLGIPAGQAAFVVILVTWAFGELNTNKAAKAMPPPPVAPNKTQMTRVQQYMNLAIQAADANGDKALVAHLNESPVKKPAEVEL